VPGLMATAPCPSQSHRLLTASSVDTAIGSVAVLVRAAIAVASFWASTLVRKRRPLRFHLLFDALKISGAHERRLWVAIVVSLNAAPHKIAECQGLAIASFGATTRTPLPSTVHIYHAQNPHRAAVVPWHRRISSSQFLRTPRSALTKGQPRNYWPRSSGATRGTAKALGST
jgi:hypothetical protein